MKIDEIVRRLEAWKNRHDEMMRQYESLRKLIGAAPDCELMASFFSVWGAYTVAVGEIVGDQSEWLQYFEGECDMGREPRRVVLHTGKEITVKTLRQLARVIASCQA